MSYVITTAIDIDATAESVWDVLVDFASYGEWSTFSRARGTARVGSELTMTMPGMTFRPTVEVATPGRELRWAGTLLTPRLFRGQHSFTLTTRPDGTTRLTNREEFSGVLVALTSFLFRQHDGENGYTAFNARLKQRVEDRTRQGRELRTGAARR